jgi:hypothetical protein
VLRSHRRSLTGFGPSGCIAPVKSLLLFSIVIVGTSCTTLENRRDLYRSPAEGYERWYRRPPPTRKPAGPPVPASEVPAGAIERHGVITFPDTPLPEGDSE